jgi:phage tail-like protein
MQSEEFKYFVVNSPEIWQGGFADAIRVRPDGSVSLWSDPRTTVMEGINRPAGFTVDSHGNLYVIDAADCRIYRRKSQSDDGEQAIECIPYIGGCGKIPGRFKFYDKESDQYAGFLAVKRSTILVSDTYNHRVQAFSLRNFQIQYILGATDNYNRPISGKGPGEFDTPTEIAVNSKGCIYVLDSGNQRIQKFNGHGKAMPFNANGLLSQPISLCVDDMDFIYILDLKKQAVFKLDSRGINCLKVVDIKAVSTQIIPSALGVDSNGLIYIGEKGKDRLLKIHIFDQEGICKGRFGKYKDICNQLLADGGLYASCGEERSFLFFTAGERVAKEGILYLKSFDSVDARTNWHKISMDAVIQEKTKIKIFYFISNEEIDIYNEPNVNWQECLSSPENGYEATEGLINGQGRYLTLKIMMSGFQEHSPRINYLKIYFPRISYLRYLPAVYQEKESSRIFLERFLSLFESMSNDMEAKIGAIPKYFNPRATPQHFLKWLASWLAVSVDENWPEGKSRKFIQEAYEYYKIRGTLKGLKVIIELFTGITPRIIEHHHAKRPMALGKNAVLGVSSILGKADSKGLILGASSTIGEFILSESDDPPEKPFEVNAYDFSVMVDTSNLETKDQVNALKRLIEEEKPAHTNVFIHDGDSDFQLGVNSLVGINTVVSKGFPTMRLGSNSFLGKNTFLGTRYPVDGIIEARSKVGVSTVLR